MWLHFPPLRCRIDRHLARDTCSTWFIRNQSRDPYTSSYRLENVCYPLDIHIHGRRVVNDDVSMSLSGYRRIVHVLHQSLGWLRG
jgi:hypothetical protein